MPAHAVVVTNTDVPIDTTLFIPCANGGVGELVHVAGPHHMVISVTLDGRGGFHAHLLFNPQGVNGVGLTTGNKYRGVGKTELDFNGVTGSTTTSAFTFNLIGQRRGNDIRVHENVHMTVNAGGSTTASVDDVRITCS
jgi:hypothetical protein